MEEKIIEAYKAMLIAGEKPLNSYTLCQKVGMKEKEFFELYSSADDVGRKVFGLLAEEAIEALNASKEAQQYSSQDKIMAYYYTFFQIAVSHRSFIDAAFHKDKGLLRDYRVKYKEYIGDVIQEGIAMEEIVERLSLSSYYPDMLWQLHLRLINFWLADTSEHFVETEKAIAIYSQLPLELMGHNLLDSFLETAKFTFDRFKSGRLDFDIFNAFRRN